MRVSEILFPFCVAFLVLLPFLLLGAVKVERLQEMLHTEAEENQIIVETIAKVLNESGAMYRPIKR